MRGFFPFQLRRLLKLKIHNSDILEWYFNVRQWGLERGRDYSRQDIFELVDSMFSKDSYFRERVMDCLNKHAPIDGEYFDDIDQWPDILRQRDRGGAFIAFKNPDMEAFVNEFDPDLNEVEYQGFGPKLLVPDSHIGRVVTLLMAEHGAYEIKIDRVGPRR